MSQLTSTPLYQLSCIQLLWSWFSFLRKFIFYPKLIMQHFESIHHSIYLWYKSFTTPQTLIMRRRLISERKFHFWQQKSWIRMTRLVKWSVVAVNNIKIANHMTAYISGSVNYLPSTVFEKIEVYQLTCRINWPALPLRYCRPI